MKYDGRLEGHEIVPRPTRIDTSFDVLVRCAAGEFDANITNLSGSGFRLRSTGGLEPGWEVLLQVPNMAAVKGLIRWVAGNDAGGVFMDAVAL
jgi:PilZ domain-containing protein